MCHLDGFICKTHKLTKFKTFEKGVEHNPLFRVDIFVIDDFFLYTKKNVPKFFESTSKQMLQMVIQSKATRYDVIFDQYFCPHQSKIMKGLLDMNLHYWILTILDPIKFEYLISRKNCKIYASNRLSLTFLINTGLLTR